MSALDETPTQHRARRPGPGAWPLLVLVVLLALLLGWRVHDTGTSTASSASTPQVPLRDRTIGAARLAVPNSWITLDRGRDHATWGTADRSQTVTLTSTEASVLPLPGVVVGSVRAATKELPQARSIGTPRVLDLATSDSPAAGDSAMLVRFRVDPPGRPGVEVQQVWRRAARAGVDVVATWTSADGTWTISPRSAIPRIDASR